MTPRAVHLQRTPRRADELDEVCARLGERVGLAAVTGDLSRRGSKAKVPGRVVDRGFTWNAADQADPIWWPQGITAGCDAKDTEDLGGHEVLITSWYAKPKNGFRQGSRISVVDVDSYRYQHVLLIQPDRTAESGFKPLRVHAGGLAWCGPYLYVASTRRGIVATRLDDITKVSDSSKTFGYDYVLPIEFEYSGGSDAETDLLRYSFVSIDRTSEPAQLVAGEFGRGSMSTRVVRYALDPLTWRLREGLQGGLHEGQDQIAEPTFFDLRGKLHTQGIARVNGVYFATSSAGPVIRGSMHIGHPGAFKTLWLSIPIGPEDITYWASRDEFWSSTEYPDKRYVFAMKRTELEARATRARWPARRSSGKHERRG